MQDIDNIIENEFKLSQDASNRIKILLKSEDSSFFRISVLGGGCSGFQYDFSFSSSPTDDDDVLTQDGISYIIYKCMILNTSMMIKKNGLNSITCLNMYMKR